MKVRVYRNLHKKCLSVQAMVDGRWKVIKHVDAISLHNPVFKVSQAGRQRVLREKRKNVHAFVVGIHHEWSEHMPCGNRRVSYNPYKADTFMCDGEPILSANQCRIDSGGIFVW